jgi:hypothetical protein
MDVAFFFTIDRTWAVGIIVYCWQPLGLALLVYVGYVTEVMLWGEGLILMTQFCLLGVGICGVLRMTGKQFTESGETVEFKELDEPMDPRVTG